MPQYPSFRQQLPLLCSLSCFYSQREIADIEKWHKGEKRKHTLKRGTIAGNNRGCTNRREKIRTLTGQKRMRQKKRQLE
jgi:hypothetical protein